MSEFSLTRKQRQEKLLEVSSILLQTGNAHGFIVNNRDFIATVIPSDFIELFDELIQHGHRIEDLKPFSNKLLNIFHIPLNEYKGLEPPQNSFLFALKKNNDAMVLVLDEIRPVFKLFAADENNDSLKLELTRLFEKLSLFASHYVIKENVLFPVIEKSWPDYRCIQLMWSFHDDIRRNIKYILDMLQSGVQDMTDFKRKVGDVFFNMMTIRFREEKILFPHLLNTISSEELEAMNRAGFEIGYPYFQPHIMTEKSIQNSIPSFMTDLGTGALTAEQLILLFNHLPVDITFVDENDRVQFFSSPKDRIFPRTTAIIGREVKNCHPPESVHVVEKIVEAFRSGTKDKAQFWIQMKGRFILIQYFAIRDKNGIYKGVLEVSQDATEIRSLSGEKRLLEWE